MSETAICFDDLTLSDAESVELKDIPVVRAKLRILDGQLELRQIRETPAEKEDRRDDPDRLIDVKEFSARACVSEKFIYAHAHEWTFTRKLSPKCVRFVEKAADAWIRSRKAGL